MHLSQRFFGNHGLRSACLAVLAVGWLSTGIVAADKDGPTYTDPQAAGEEYAAQGEFSGPLEADDNRVWGAQVIALGKGNYRLVAYPDGLPGAGYVAGNETKTADGKREGDRVVFKADEYVAEIHGDTLTVSAEGQKLGEIKRIKRESTTLGKSAPAGAIVLFDGSSADKFKGGKMSEDKLLMADTASLEKFGDHSLHIEFRTPFRPEARGQGRGNSGVYVQSRYEVQVLDSFGLSGEDNECGGIYKVAKPKVNMCYPPLTWQTYDIDFVAAKYDAAGKKTSNANVTIRHNGVVIHEKLEIKSGTPGRLPEGASEEPLYLQGHGNPVVYRNIWVVKK
ncbi:MAG: DUF1080 domain-containing protein [Pirellulaceae bacterium]|nr:DUF1080 domain-containing protein [Pirellulaceae bacterium]